MLDDGNFALPFLLLTAIQWLIVLHFCRALGKDTITNLPGLIGAFAIALLYGGKAILFLACPKLLYLPPNLTTDLPPSKDSFLSALFLSTCALASFCAGGCLWRGVHPRAAVNDSARPSRCTRPVLLAGAVWVIIYSLYIRHNNYLMGRYVLSTYHVRGVLQNLDAILVPTLALSALDEGSASKSYCLIGAGVLILFAHYIIDGALLAASKGSLVYLGALLLAYWVITGRAMGSKQAIALFACLVGTVLFYPVVGWYRWVSLTQNGRGLSATLLLAWHEARGRPHWLALEMILGRLTGFDVLLGVVERHMRALGLRCVLDVLRTRGLSGIDDYITVVVFGFPSKLSSGTYTSLSPSLVGFLDVCWGCRGVLGGMAVIGGGLLGIWDYLWDSRLLVARAAASVFCVFALELMVDGPLDYFVFRVAPAFIASCAILEIMMRATCFVGHGEAGR